MIALIKTLGGLNFTLYFNLKVAVGLVIFLMSFNGHTEEEILSLDGARIRGNQELPNVLYLIPWKPPKVYRLDQPGNSLGGSSTLQALERSSFKRLISYHQAFKQGSEPVSRKKE